MHKSRLGAIVIDCQTDDLETAAAFWSRALGRPARGSDDPEAQNYMWLETAPEEVKILLQKVEHPSRVHIDIKTDDVEAEANRLEQLGAKRLKSLKGWWVMEAPSGHRFCVVPQGEAGFAGAVNDWS